MIELRVGAVIALLVLFVGWTAASTGDRSQFFINCVRGCRVSNCSDDGLTFASARKAMNQDFFNRLLLWTCNDECLYHCLWRTTNSFVARKWQVPQFFGKWPFKRLLGMQEPASVLFSLLNLIVHWRMIRKFRREVRPDSPMYYVWHVFCMICINAWIFSIIFHTRDFPITELFDYGFAYSMVITNFCCMVLRMLYKSSNLLKSLIVFSCGFFYINHLSYLAVGRFDYSYNMKANVATGIVTGVGWLTWYFRKRVECPYARKMLIFQILAAAALLLELNDFPPIFWMFDAHALWHLATVPLTVLFYNFVIEDSKYMRKMTIKVEAADDNEKQKLI